MIAERREGVVQERELIARKRTSVDQGQEAGGEQGLDK
jgi:hypothetical protein